MASGITPLINVSNLDKSTEFYKGLGFKVRKDTQDTMTWSVVTSGEDELILYPKTQRPDMEQPEDTDNWLKGELGKGLVLMLGVGDAKKRFEKAKEIRASIEMPLDENPWGGHSFRVVDPDGYVLSISDKFPG